LHWACKRGHATIAQVLLQNGADVGINTFKGELPYELTTSTEVLAALKIDPDEEFTKRCSEGTSHLPIVPNYLKSSAFPYAAPDSDDLDSTQALSSPKASVDVKSTSEPDYKSERTGDDVAHKSSSAASKRNAYDGDRKNLASTCIQPSPNKITSSMIIRARVAGGDTSVVSDFVEVEVPSPSYSSLLESCCEELDLTPEGVARIRKLPNVWIRKDKDVQRLNDGQELELILKTDQ
jgi:hypothetical protein